jgi:hypothetical protein
MYSVDGPWSEQQETELLHLYHFRRVEGRRVEGLEGVWELVRPGPKGAQYFSRAEALEWIKQIRRSASGRPAP